MAEDDLSVFSDTHTRENTNHKEAKDHLLKILNESQCVISPAKFPNVQEYKYRYLENPCHLFDGHQHDVTYVRRKSAMDFTGRPPPGEVTLYSTWYKY